MRLALAIYRLLLVAYPPSFRRANAEQILSDIRDRLDGCGPLAAARLAVREVIDLVRNLPGAWHDARPLRDGFGTESGLGGLGRDLAYAARSMRARPGFSAVVVATLALGIGANAAVFGVVDSVLLEPLPYPDAEELVYLVESYRDDQTRSVSYPNFTDWRARNRTFQDLGAQTLWTFTLTGSGDAEVLTGLIVSASLLPILGVDPVQGRAFNEDEELREDRVVLLGHGFWLERFGEDPDVIGRTLTLNDEPWTVVGVLPPGLEFPLQADVYAPLTTLADGDQSSRGSRPGIYVIGRLLPGATLESARADMEGVTAALATEFPGPNADSGAVLEALRERYLSSARPVLVPLMGAVALVFLIACANVANLFLVRAQARRREAAVRTVLGGRKGRILPTYLAEAGLLAAVGALLGVGLARFGVSLLAQLGAAGVPRLARAEVDGTVLLFTVGASVLATLLVGALPALRLSTVDPARELVHGGARGGTAAGGRARAGLVVSEVALSFVLLVGAVLMVRTMANLGAADPAFEPRAALTVGLPIPSARYPTDAERARFVDEVLERVAALPGVTAAAAGDPLPMGGNNRQMRTVTAEPGPVGEEGLRTDWYSATPGYFETMGIRFVEGGTWNADVPTTSPPAVVDRTFADRFWPGEGALGRQVRFRGDSSPWFTVVGVVEHVSHYGPRTEGREQIYVPHSVRVFGQNLVIRSERDPAELAAEVRAVVAEIDDAVPLRRVATLASLVDGAVAGERLAARALGAFAAAALALAMLGLYGVVSYSVNTRRREIGIRIALGARGQEVLRGVAGSGVALAALGVLIGLVAALAATRLLERLLFGVEPVEATAWAAAAGLLLLVSALATVVPALRASRLDPARTLRAD